uniref:BED-type domain-containing protein n=1 Tax=Nymphaea colorata TaxID=210225 RepID=A0A5K1FAT3_9MAGN|nr:unnamed protein product [Nymphaea colorata]
MHKMPRGKDMFWSHATQSDDGKLICEFCSEQYAGGITRFKYHLAGLQGNDAAPCSNVPENVKQRAIIACGVISDRPMKKGRMQSGSESHSSVGSPSSGSNFFCGTLSEGGTGQGQQQTIPGMMKKVEKDFVDKLLLKGIVMNNLPFNLLQSVDFKNFVAAATNFGPRYILPSSETTRTKLLDEARKDALVYVDEMKKTWTKSGCTIMSDIWKDTIRSKFYINLLVSSPTGTVFWKASQVEKGPKSAEFIVDFLSPTIEEIGANNVVQIVTDNGSNYRKAKRILEGKYPNIFTTSCAAHCIDLMLEDIDSLEDVKNIMCKARQAVKFLYNKQHALDIMRTYTKGKELRRPGVTRFASQFICLDSILKQEEGLKFMVASNDWRHVENTEKNDAKELTRLIQNEDFWRKGKEIIRFVEPLVRVLKMVDGEGATMGYLYEALDRAKEAIKSACNNMRE